MVIDLSGKQKSKIAWRWTKQMAMTSIRRKKHSSSQFMHNSKGSSAATG
jgi:hypothetical protein